MWLYWLVEKIAALLFFLKTRMLHFIISWWSCCSGRTSMLISIYVSIYLHTRVCVLNVVLTPCWWVWKEIFQNACKLSSFEFCMHLLFQYGQYRWSPFTFLNISVFNKIKPLITMYRTLPWFFCFHYLFAFFLICFTNTCACCNTHISVLCMKV